MRVLILVLIGLLCVCHAWAQTTATPGQSLAWEHATADAELVTRFEVSYDQAASVGVGRTRHPTLANTFYAPLPALITGSHTVTVRACNANGCSIPSAVFTFSMVAGVPSIVAAGSIVIIATPAP